MFKDEAAILQAAATLAAAEKTAHAMARSGGEGMARYVSAPNRSAVNCLRDVLREMADVGLIPPDLAPPKPQAP